MIKLIIATLENKLVLRKLGRLQSLDKEALQQCLKRIRDKKSLKQNSTWHSSKTSTAASDMV